MRKFVSLIICCFVFCIGSLQADNPKIVTTANPFTVDTIHWTFESWKWALKGEEICKVEDFKNLNDVPKGSFSFESQLQFGNDGNIVMSDEDLKKFLSDKEIVLNKDYPNLDGRYDIEIDDKAQIINSITIYCLNAKFTRTALRSFELPQECEIFNGYNKVNADRLREGKDRLILGNADFSRSMDAMRVCDEELWFKIQQNN